MKYLKDHDPKCPAKARRLYIRDYDPFRKKQTFIIWGATCLSCGQIFHLKQAIVTGTEKNNYFLNRSQKRHQDRIKERFEKKLDMVKDPKKKALIKKQYERLLKKGIKYPG